MATKFNPKKKDKKPISSFDLFKIFNRLNFRLKTRDDCLEIIRILYDWNIPVEVRDLNYEVRRRGIYTKNDIRHFTRYRLRKMIKGRILSEVKDNGRAKYMLNVPFKPNKRDDLEYLSPWHLTIDLEYKIDRYRNIVLDLKDEDILKLLRRALSKLEQKLNNFIPYCKDISKKILDTISIIRELDSIYYKFEGTDRVPDNECWLYNKFRNNIAELKLFQLSDKQVEKIVDEHNTKHRSKSHRRNSKGEAP